MGVKAKLDLENSEEAKAVEAVMAGLKEKYSQWGHCEDGKVEDEQEVVVVGKHVQECIENVIEQGRRNIVKALEGGTEGHIQEGGVDVGLKAKRKLRRQRWS